MALTDKGLENVKLIDTTKEVTDPARYQNFDLQFNAPGTKEVFLQRADESPTHKRFLLRTIDNDGTTTDFLISDDGTIIGKICTGKSCPPS